MPDRSHQLMLLERAGFAGLPVDELAALLATCPVCGEPIPSADQAHAWTDIPQEKESHQS